MKKFIVGGYVRDRLLGLRPKDKDYVLVGANKKDIEYLKSIGFEQVGADFPVFIDKEGNEHALARTERKVGTGYSGFEVNTQGVTLQEDLYRRDLTINAIAFDPQLRVHIDPYGGKHDLQNKVLRHVSDHFGEDPLRVLRLARFSSRYSTFKVHSSTEELVRNMVLSGELLHLTPERVYVEFEKAFTEKNPVIFLKNLAKWGALEQLIPNFEPTASTWKELEHICENCTELHKEFYLWNILLHGADISTDYRTGQVKLPARFATYHKYFNQHNAALKGFRRTAVPEMVNILRSMNVKNNGGEEFLYKVLENMILLKKIDLDLEDLIIRVYDRYESTEIGDIQQMLKDGTLDSKGIPDYVFNLRVQEVKKIFQ